MTEQEKTEINLTIEIPNLHRTKAKTKDTALKPLNLLLKTLDQLFSRKQLTAISALIILTSLSTATMTLTQNTIENLAIIDPQGGEVEVKGDMQVNGDIDPQSLNGTPVDELGSQNIEEVLTEGGQANGQNLNMQGGTITLDTGETELLGVGSINLEDNQVQGVSNIGGYSGAPITVDNNLDLSGTSYIQNIAGFKDTTGTTCSSEETLAGDGSCIAVSQIDPVQNDINMTGYNIKEINQLTGENRPSSENHVKVGSPGIDMQNNNINDVNCIGDNC